MKDILARFPRRPPYLDQDRPRRIGAPLVHELLEVHHQPEAAPLVGDEGLPIEDLIEVEGQSIRSCGRCHQQGYDAVEGQVLKLGERIPIREEGDLFALLKLPWMEPPAREV